MTWYSAVAPELSREVLDVRSEQLTELRKLLIGAQKWLNSKPQGSKLI